MPMPAPPLRVVITRGRTRNNRLHLPGHFLAGVEAEYAGTRLGRQELDGELIEDIEGALWTRAMLEACRAPELLPGEAAERCTRIVVGVDPPAGTGGDACGIIVAGLGHDGRGHVLGDSSVTGARPGQWARVVREEYGRWRADRIVAEANQGGEMVREVLEQAGAVRLPVRLVHASRGKSARAEPVAALYERGAVAHCGRFTALEDEMAGLTIGGAYEGPGRSPDRADALVWALTELMLGRRGEPRVLGL